MARNVLGQRADVKFVERLRQDAAGLDARRRPHEADRDGERDSFAGHQRDKVRVQHRVGDGVEVDVLEQRLVLGAVGVDLHAVGLRRVDERAQRELLDGEMDGLLRVAVEHARHLAGGADGLGGLLASLARRRVEGEGIHSVLWKRGGWAGLRWGGAPRDVRGSWCVGLGLETARSENTHRAARASAQFSLKRDVRRKPLALRLTHAVF